MGALHTILVSEATLLVNPFSVYCKFWPFNFFDFEWGRRLRCFLVEDLGAFFTSVALELLLDVVLGAELFFVALSDDDTLKGKANSFREFLVILLLTILLETICTCLCAEF